ncbi:hypothetical protein V7112_16525 [Bacillus sp. JJ1566]|uniref:hypothetical protein n=1 Tax=Bacillus sp. JJ1566 TaxID=3122961 RepID=UPI002FFFDCB7
MKKSQLILYMCTLIFLLVGCKAEEVDVSDSYIKDQNNVLQEKVVELEDKIKRIENENLLNAQSLEEWYKEFDKKYSILRADKWEKVIINVRGDEKEVSITDDRIITAFRDLLGGFREPEPFGSGPFSDVPNYQYTFVKDGKELTIDTLSRNIIRVEDDYYETSNDIHLLGNAFFNPPPYFKGSIPILTKLALSGYMEVDTDYSYGMFSSFRIISLANALAEQGEEINYIPSDLGEVSLKIHFYFFGETITLNIYEENYIQVVEGDKEYWFYMNETHIFHNILSAG